MVEVFECNGVSVRSAEQADHNGVWVIQAERAGVKPGEEATAPIVRICAAAGGDFAAIEMEPEEAMAFAKSLLDFAGDI